MGGRARQAGVSLGWALLRQEESQTNTGGCPRGLRPEGPGRSVLPVGTRRHPGFPSRPSRPLSKASTAQTLPGQDGVQKCFPPCTPGCLGHLNLQNARAARLGEGARAECGPAAPSSSPLQAPGRSGGCDGKDIFCRQPLPLERPPLHWQSAAGRRDPARNRQDQQKRTTVAARRRQRADKGSLQGRDK